jgi:hypothetical protein
LFQSGSKSFYTGEALLWIFGKRRHHHLLNTWLYPWYLLA